MSFNDKVVLITGASSGIGRASAVEFAKLGAKLLLADINADGGAETIHQVQAVGGEAEYITCDVTQANEVDTMVKRAVELYGGLHYAVNSAGISGGGMMQPILEWSDESFDQIMAINVKGIWLCMKAQIPAMINSGGGAIVNLASVAGLIGAPGGAAYSASKHAVVGLTKTVAVEFARRGVRVNAVCPSFIETPMVTTLTEVNERMAERTTHASPMKRLGQPQEIASSIVYLCSEGASFVTGITFAVDGGLTAI